MFSRNFTVKINWALDNLLPPIIRDWKPLMNFIIRFAYGDKTQLILNFKENYPDLGDADINCYYSQIEDVPVNSRKTDINQLCLNFIKENCNGTDVLDVGCGKGYLLKYLDQHGIAANFVGVDVTPTPIFDGSHGRNRVSFLQGLITNLPFNENSFDTVLCTHTLEHIRDYRLAIQELIRVCKIGGKIIIVVPKQREYKYTPDLHVHFCPYLYRFREFIGLKNAKYIELGGDFLCLAYKDVNLGKCTNA